MDGVKEAEVRKEYENVQKDRIEDIPNVISPLSKETQDKMKEVFSREKKTMGMRQMMSSKTDLTDLKNKLYQCFMMSTSKDRPRQEYQYREGGYIIMPSVSAPVVLDNVYKLLNDAEYIPQEDARRIKDSHVDIVHRDTVYHFVEKLPKNVGDNELIAVFVIGQSWQFREFPIKDPYKFLERYLGFYVRLDSKEWPRDPWLKDCTIVNTDETARLERPKELERLQRHVLANTG
ncbi:hypothetical protein EIN_054880 [Entamoeba invadens IP1]|uniref:hypothetical protein n=1 Tax=Entamoeba invadens IP1 TaxID=370355 RepID=UPI0002C3E5EB|nr:hypothetical protein EIN_054880 [Entamoeba invadens IP1]ELP93193.1 hypothetical protein EIN_054880 [Entamoeba invadens IP1]|eukprot:XP_004259964.1 hypothetical protein EIN_054880 [Entamoeba invadens IP1]